MNWGAFFQRAGRLLSEAMGAAASGAGAAYAANPHASGEQIGTAAASAAIVYVLGRVLPQLKLHAEQ